MAIFIVSFWVLVAVCLVLYFVTKSSNLKSEDGAFKKFQMVYLTVYLLAMGKFSKERNNVRACKIFPNY